MLGIEPGTAESKSKYSNHAILIKLRHKIHYNTWDATDLIIATSKNCLTHELEKAKKYFFWLEGFAWILLHYFLLRQKLFYASKKKDIKTKIKIKTQRSRR